MLLHRGQFLQYISDSAQSNILNESFQRTRSFSSSTIRSGMGTMVFISHKHSDLNNKELSGLLQYLSQKFNIIPYIDCMDPKMPEKTCAETANRIKSVIAYSERFILLATEDALKSMWCNWEVEIADKTKYQNDKMVILPLLERNQLEGDYAGNEYLRLYPYINKEVTSLGKYSYYVHIPRTQKRLRLSEWINPTQTKRIYG